MPVECVLIANGPENGWASEVRRQFQEIRILTLQSNMGFGPALNAAVEHYPAENLIFGNDDVVYDPRFVETMLDCAARGAHTVAGVLLAADQPETIDSAGVVVDSTLLAFDYIHGERASTAVTAGPPLGPTGAAALVPFTSFARIGGFDPMIFAYLEDVDLALRLRALGIECRLAHEARGVHRHSATLGSGSAAKNEVMGWSRGYMLRRYGVLTRPLPAARAIAAEVVICAGQLVVDRTGTGIVGRVRGWRAACGMPILPTPPGSTIEISLVDALRRRSMRRRATAPGASA